MRYEAVIRAYDMLDNVVVVAAVQDTSVPRTEWAANSYMWTTTVPGEGEDVPGEWLQAALVALLELL